MPLSITKCLAFNAMLLIPLIAAATVRADEKFDSAALARAVAPFIDENTAAIGHIDLTRFKSDPFIDTVHKLIPDVFGESVEQIKAKGQKGMEAFRKAGCKEIYVFLSLSNPHEPDFLIRMTPLEPDADESAIRSAFDPGGPHSAFKKIGNCLLVADRQESLERFSKMAPDPRPELTAAFEAAGDTGAQVIFTPPKHFKRVIEETMPQLPKEVGGGESKILTQGCLWAAMGIDLPPKLSLKLVVQSQDEAAANALRAKLEDASKILAQHSEVKKFVPNIDELSAGLVPQVEGSRLTLTLNQEKINGITKIAQPAVEDARQSARQVASINNLKQIGLAMHNYHDQYKCFPPAAIYSKDGKPLLSWRVAILPELGLNELYKKFHLDEPWDSPHNIELSKIPVAVYGSLGKKSNMTPDKKSFLTNFVVPVGPGTVFEGKEGMKIKDITDGTSKTILVVEVDDEHAVVWTKPDDLNYDPKEPAKGLGGHFKDVYLVLIGDGSVRAFLMTYPAEDLRAWFSAAAKDNAKEP